MRLLWLFLIIAMCATGLVEPAFALPVDVPSRLLPVWAKYQEAEDALAIEDVRQPEANEQREFALSIVEDPPFPSRSDDDSLSVAVLNWRETYLISRRLTKYQSRRLLFDRVGWPHEYPIEGESDDAGDDRGRGPAGCLRGHGGLGAHRGRKTSARGHGREAAPA